MHTPITPKIPMEPIGIVIADGGRPEHAPRFSAFVWGPAPEETAVPNETELLVAVA